MNHPQVIHPQLLNDCHLLGCLPVCSVLLNRNAAIAWFILVPETTLEDVLDLESPALGRVLEECQRISRFLKQELGYSKVNFAGLGNVVPQMHLHIIGRSQQDPCWPKPVWGNLAQVSADDRTPLSDRQETLAEEISYDRTTLSEWQETLANDYGLCARE